MKCLDEINLKHKLEYKNLLEEKITIQENRKKVKEMNQNLE